MQALDRPVWSTLTTYHLPLSEGNALARRFLPDVNLFAAARDASPEALTALTNLVEPGEKVFFAEVPALVIPTGFTVVKAAAGVQMLATRSVGSADQTVDVVELTDADAPEMLALATLTEPGPFLSRTHIMGKFLGVRIDGRRGRI